MTIKRLSQLWCGLPPQGPGHSKPCWHPSDGGCGNLHPHRPKGTEYPIEGLGKCRGLKVQAKIYKKYKRKYKLILTNAHQPTGMWHNIPHL